MDRLGKGLADVLDTGDTEAIEVINAAQQEVNLLKQTPDDRSDHLQAELDRLALRMEQIGSGEASHLREMAQQEVIERARKVAEAAASITRDERIY